MPAAMALPLVDSTPRPAGLDFRGWLSEVTAQVAGEVRVDRLSRALYSTDASVYQIVPLAVVVPRTEADVVAVVRACHRFSVPLTARGGGTSQAGQCIGPGVILDCSKYVNQVLEINAAKGWVRVQPGCVLDELNGQLKPHGLQFAPDVSTANRATIGGMVANNSCGARSLIYGKTVDHVLELQVVLSDGRVVLLSCLDDAGLTAKCGQPDLEGECYRAVRRLAGQHAEEIDRRYPKILRRVGGYNLDLFANPGPAPFNLAKFLVGSEGTLAVTLEAKLRLVPLPKAKAVLVAHFHDLLDALAATPFILEHGPSAIEVVDKYVLDSTRLNAEAARLRDFIHGDPGAILIVEFYADQKDELTDKLKQLEADLRARGFGYHYHPATDANAQARIWKLRKMALGLSMCQKGDAKAISFVEDTAVAPERLRDYIAEFLGIIAKHGTTAGVYAHASVGCLHVRPVVNLKTEAGVRQFEAIAAEVADLVLKYGGALSGEHGDGLVRSPFQEKMFGPELYAAFRELKRTFDPKNILNPGKIVDAPPLTANFRFGSAYVTPDVPTTFDFSADGGLVRATELCVGVGACRKLREGNMCPSFQATREEQHSTRGRANALRLALTGQMEMTGLTDPALKKALDLCLECKACKSECPTNVDMARLKAEFLHQYYRKTGLPWRNWVFGHVATIGDLACRFALASNWLARSWLSRWTIERLLGIDRRRRPPSWSRKNLGCHRAWLSPLFTSWEVRDQVVLFGDTFATYHEPKSAWAAMELFRRLRLPDAPGYPAPANWMATDDELLRCCGRPFISNGMLNQAIANAQHNVRTLLPLVERGMLIFALEPSCILTLQDDYPALLTGEWRAKAKVVAAACRTFEELFDARLALHKEPLFGPGPKRILVQPHCHQRALVGVEPLLRLLRRIPGAEVIDLDAGCCGMAGSFGYEKEHYEISRLVGEQRLFPAIRAAEPETVIVAPGFSCRMQIQHFTGRAALHPAELLHLLLIDQPR